MADRESDALKRHYLRQIDTSAKGLSVYLRFSPNMRLSVCVYVCVRWAKHTRVGGTVGWLTECALTLILFKDATQAYSAIRERVQQILP